jgi:hypothetical protein
MPVTDGRSKAMVSSQRAGGKRVQCIMSQNHGVRVTGIRWGNYRNLWSFDGVVLCCGTRNAVDGNTKAIVPWRGDPIEFCAICLIFKND